MHWPKKRKLKLAENSFAFATCFWVTQTASRIVGNAPAAAARGYEWREREPVNIKWTHRVLPGSLLLGCSCACWAQEFEESLARPAWPCPSLLHRCTVLCWTLNFSPPCRTAIPFTQLCQTGAAELTKRKMWRERVKGKYFRDTNRPQDVFLAGKYGLYSGILSGIRLLHEWI